MNNTLDVMKQVSIHVASGVPKYTTEPPMMKVNFLLMDIFENFKGCNL
jgi:hypothetical protein